jgi:hypothetical protein
MKSIGRILLSAICIIMLGSVAWTQAAGDFRSLATGNWSATGTWERYSSTATWEAFGVGDNTGTGIPASTSAVVIRDGHTVTIDQASTTVASLTVGEGASGILAYDATSARALTVNGNLTVSLGGSSLVFVTLAPTGDLTNTSNIISNVSSTAGVAIGMNISGTGIPGGATVSAFDATSITLSAAATATNTGVTLAIKPTVTQTLAIGGNILNNGTFDMSLGSSTTVCNVTFNNTGGDQTISTTGTPTITRFRGITLSKGVVGNRVVCSINASDNGSSPGAITFTNGTWEQTQNTLTIGSGNQTIPITGSMVFSGSGSLSVPGASPTVTGNLTVNTSGTINIGGGNNSLTINGATATATFTSGTVSILGKFIMTSGTTTINGANISIDPQATSSLATSGNTFELGTTANFTFSSGSVTIVDPNSGNDARTGTDVKFPATSGAVSWTGGILYIGDGASTTPATGTGFLFQGGTPLGNVVVQGGGISGRNILINTNTVVNGTLTMKSGTVNLAASKTLTYGASGTLLYNGSIAQTMTNAEFPAANGPLNLTINNTSGVVLNALRTINGTLTLTSGALSGCAGYLTLGSGATISRSGGSLDAAPLLFTGGTNLIYTSSAGVITTGFELPAAANNITISNANGVTLASGVTLSGTLTLTTGLLSGCTVNLALGSGAAISRSGGSLDAAPTFGATTNVIYAAPTPPASITTGFELPTAVNNLTINNSSGVTLSAITTVGGILTMTSGNINLNSFAMSLGSSTSSTGTLTYTSGFLTGSGSFSRWFAASLISGVGGQFPMGVGSNDRSLFVSGTPSTGGTVSVSYNDASSVSTPFGAGFTDGTAFTFLNRCDANWVVAVANGFAGSSLGLAINGFGIAGIVDYNQLNVSGATVAAPGTYAAPSGSNSSPTVNRTGFDQSTLPLTYYFASTSTNVLPVEMTSFSASANRLSSELRWSTATEVNNFGFEIERKSANTGWSKIAFVAGAGTSTSLHNYSYTDNVGQAGMYQYRVKQVDKNGTFKYSSEMQVEVGAVAKVLSLGDNYPNPFNPTTSIEFSIPTDGRAVLKVYNMLGQEVATLFEGVAASGKLMKASFDASRLSSGVYFSRLESGGHALVKRMLLLK